MQVLKLFFCVVLVAGFANGRIQFSHGMRQNYYFQRLDSDVTGAKYLNMLTERNHWFTQKLDHFQTWDTRTWQQRYFVNDQFFRHSHSSPVFISIGGEGRSYERDMKTGSWYVLAKKFGALMFHLEHRFYGESQPTKDLSTENLRYLSSQQALRDLKTFITAMKIKYGLTNTNRWIAFGGSYAGSLAAWLRLKFPNLVHGAIASSAPLLAKTDFWEYLQVVQDSLRTHSDECVEAVKDAFQTAESLAQTAEGRLELDALFLLCEPLESLIQKNAKNVPNLIGSFANSFAGVVQHNNILPRDTTIDDVCSLMVNEEVGEPLARLATLVIKMQKGLEKSCLDHNYNADIQEMQAESWESQVAAGRQWTYQTCTEFGWYQTSSQENQVFGTSFPVNYSTDQCAEIFGPDFDAAFINRAINYTNRMYGALDIKESNIVYVHGTIDPWHAVGLNRTRRKDAPVILINGTAHCADMNADRADDLPQLKEARAQINKLIKSWLRQ